MTFRAILKNGTISFKTAVDSFWAIIEKIGLLKISKSGHTAQNTEFETFLVVSDKMYLFSFFCSLAA